MTDDEALTRVQDSFTGTGRPDYFTRYWHCCECAEHNDTLSRVTPDTISLQDVGHPGWDPICFTTEHAFTYFLPGLCRLALETHNAYYLDQFLFHLDQPGRLDGLSSDQRRALRLFMHHLYDTRLEEIISNMDEYALQSLMNKLGTDQSGGGDAHSARAP
jgi:hypothetical protein